MSETMAFSIITSSSSSATTKPAHTNTMTTAATKTTPAPTPDAATMPSSTTARILDASHTDDVNHTSSENDHHSGALNNTTHEISQSSVDKHLAGNENAPKNSSSEIGCIVIETSINTQVNIEKVTEKSDDNELTTNNKNINSDLSSVTIENRLTRSQSLPHLLSLPTASDNIDVARQITESEFKRMGFTKDNKWRITNINQDFKLCNTYPRFLILPSSVKEEDLDSVAKFRYFRRIPTAVWRHTKNGCFIARSSQPSVGWFGWRNEQDENLLQAFVDNSTPIVVNNNNSSNNNNNSSIQQEQQETAINGNNSQEQQTSRLLIVDARSYTAAVANRAKGGGCECSEYYQRCEVQFMNLANIHSIRKSFHAIKSVCETYSEQSNNWLSLLENSRWLHHISGLLKSALIVVETIDLEEKSTLIHCSDGWDRTPQIVALAEIMLDPFYRTFDGFRILIQREWLDFGHKFADRCGNSPNCDDPNERCPVFLQWLDCVHQLINQFPTHFEFNSHYLVKLINHTYSCVFGTFLCNSAQERILNRIDDQTFSVWSYFESSRNRFVNDKFSPNSEVLRPSCKVKDLYFWKEVYLPPLRTSPTGVGANGGTNGGGGTGGNTSTSESSSPSASSGGGSGSTSNSNGFGIAMSRNISSTIFDLDGSCVATTDNPQALVQAKMNQLAHKLQGAQIASTLRIGQQDPIATLKTILRI